MKKFIKKIIINLFRIFGIGIMNYNSLEELKKYVSAVRDLKILQRFNNQNAQKILKYFTKSKSQYRQDLFVLYQLEFKKNGYFVEFGATNGHELSNTLLLEKEFSWNGILVEPARVWQNDLKKNRNCNIETDCVWKETGSKIDFKETEDANLSSICSFKDNDVHKKARKKGKVYQVQTISLNDLLLKYNAPKHIEYLSIDTEGGEYEILSHFNFSEYTFDIITCEHNYSPQRNSLYSLLTGQGYQRVFEDLSIADDWYVKSNSTKSKI